MGRYMWLAVLNMEALRHRVTEGLRHRGRTLKEYPDIADPLKLYAIGRSGGSYIVIVNEVIGLEDVNKIIENFKRRNIEAYYFETVKQAEYELMDKIPLGVSVGIGNSQTLKEMRITEKLEERGNSVFDKTKANSKTESREISQKALLSDWYIMSSNAVSQDGHIVNIDHTGNRVAALIYGPEKVVIIIGVNKIEKSLEEAIGRARNTAAILNAKRAGLNPPCIELNRCVDCKSKDRACNNLVIVEGQVDKDRLKVFIVNECVGF